MLKKLYMFGVFLILLMSFAGCKKEQPVVIERLQSSSEEQNVSAVSEEEQILQEDDEMETDAQQEENTIFVYVCGAVASPDVYELPAGSRVFQAIGLAGGFTDDAAKECVNQADILQDAQMIRIYTVQEYEELKQSGETDVQQNISASENQSAAENEGKVNLNTATLEELMTLSGIGETKAKAIISYREEQGSFHSIEEIKNVDGIKDGVFTAIKDDITVQ